MAKVSSIGADSVDDAAVPLSSAVTNGQQPVDGDKALYNQHQQQQTQVQEEAIDPNAILVLHPGSRNLRLGRPSDSVPYTVLHAIARRQKDPADPAQRRLDPPIVPLAKMSSERLQEVDECRLKVIHTLQSSLMSDGTRRFATPAKQLSTHNRRVTPQLDASGELCASLTVPTQEYVTGDKVSLISPAAPYHIHYPWQRGDLNTHTGLGGSVTSVMADLNLIWTQAIQDKLGVNKTDFKKYRCCVVIPDLYNRDHVIHITELLLGTMGFAACFVFQDHVAATFGSGLGCACVVDVGDQKTSVSCVEDALSIPSSRLRLGYGGSDVSQVLHWLLRKSGFPRQMQPAAAAADARLINDIKHNTCHLDLDKCGPQEHQFRVEEPGRPAALYSLQLGDELLLAPLSLCYPTLLQLTGDKTHIITQPPNAGHHQDPFDDNYLRDTSRRSGKETTEVTAGGEGVDEDMVGVEESPSVVLSGGGGKGGDTAGLSGLLSLEQAIHTSIERCSEEARRRLYATVLLVGAGASFPHLGRWLHSRLQMQVAMQYRPEQMEVISRPKDLEPGMIAWKGAALMTGLDGSAELWISEVTWKKNGVRVLREKCPFIW